MMLIFLSERYFVFHFIQFNSIRFDYFSEQIYVGPFNAMVWALDANDDIYIREGILPNFPIGTNWMKIEGIQAVQLGLR